MLGRLGILGTPLQSWGLEDGKDSEISVLCEGDWESPGLSYCPGDRTDSGISVLCEGGWESLGLPCSPGDLEKGRTVGFQCCVRETGNPWDSLTVPGTWGREGQWDFSAA